MKSRVVLMCLVGLVAITTDASAQSLLDKVKKAANKAAQEVVQKATKEVKQKVINNKQTDGKPTDKASSGKDSQSVSSHTLPFPEKNTALFAPLGYPCDPLWGTKPHTLSKPPREETKQPDWMDARPAEPEYDNASLVKAYKMLKECLETKYFGMTSPAAFGLFNVEKELTARCNALDDMVKYYTMVMDEYENLSYDDGLDHGALLEQAKSYLCNALKNNHYKSTIRTSIAPLKEYLRWETVEYFEKHGGFENAHKAKFTVIQENEKPTVSTSSSGQSGTVFKEGATGAHTEIDGITYIIHLKEGYAFASAVVEMAVRGKDVVMPDYINYNGKKFPVKEMRADLFINMDLKSIKLPATLTVISFRAFMRSGISEVVIPASVKTIQGSAFAECQKLKKVVFEGDRIDELSGCFQRCNALQSINLPRSVGKMSYDMFSGCSNLTSVTLPDNLKELPDNTFQNCTKLTSVTVPASVTKIGAYVFEGSGVVSLDLSHAMELDSFGRCMYLKNLKLNTKLKDVFIGEVYGFLEECPHMVLKFENGQYVYPAGLQFVDTR